MKVQKFFQELNLIENYLLTLAGNWDKRQGFLKLLKYLQSKNLLTKDAFINLCFIWDTRRKIVTSLLSNEEEITNEVLDILIRLKQQLPYERI